MNKQEAIEAMIISLLKQNILRVGDKVFSLRKIADLNNASLSPAIAAYRHLESVGILEGKPKSGYFVARLPNLSFPDRHRGTTFQEYDFESAELSRIFFNCSDPALGDGIKYRYSTMGLPNHLLNLQEFLNSMSKSFNTYQNGNDLRCLRNDVHALATFLSRTLITAGCIVGPEDIRIVRGLTHAILLGLKACCNRNDTVIISCPGSNEFFSAVKLYGSCYKTVPCAPRKGLDLSALEATVDADPSVRCVLCTPNFSLPTGASMSAENKKRLADFCRSRDIAIIEVDLDGERYFTPTAPTKLKSLAPDHVIYIGNLVYDATGCCYISGGKYHNKISSLVEMTRTCIPEYTQNAILQYVQSKKRENHMAYIRSSCAEAAVLAHQTILDCFPKGTKVTCPQGGIHIWVELPKRYDAQKLLRAALEKSVSFTVGPVYSPTLAFRNCLCLNIAILADRPKKIEGLQILGKLLSSQI